MIISTNNMKRIYKYKPQLEIEIDFGFWTTPYIAWNNHSKTIEIAVLCIGFYIDFNEVE